MGEEGQHGSVIDTLWWFPTRRETPLNFPPARRRCIRARVDESAEEALLFFFFFFSPLHPSTIERRRIEREHRIRNKRLLGGEKGEN